MTSTQIIVISIVVIAVIALAVAIFFQSRTKKLRARFGPEYDRALEQTGSRSKAEAELENLEKRVSRYELFPLSLADRAQFQESWRAIQANFVDDPGSALAEADHLIVRVMSARGYPMNDFEHRAAEISVDHATVVHRYRAGHDIAIRQSRREATTEDLRQAMIHYRALFDELIQEPDRARAQVAGRG
ncbi:MAG TPA: hypothetical protein VHX49_17350 [Candidatus Acidoferrales bacterium]|jgi:hypothetical protein|nr:hypothetical protein [Candidatus Acidoferrales bacterium]